MVFLPFFILRRVPGQKQVCRCLKKGKMNFFEPPSTPPVGLPAKGVNEFTKNNEKAGILKSLANPDHYSCFSWSTTLGCGAKCLVVVKPIFRSS
jgi:hypothetical protein